MRMEKWLLVSTLRGNFSGRNTSTAHSVDVAAISWVTFHSGLPFRQLFCRTHPLSTNSNGCLIFVAVLFLKTAFMVKMATSVFCFFRNANQIEKQKHQNHTKCCHFTHSSLSCGLGGFQMIPAPRGLCVEFYLWKICSNGNFSLQITQWCGDLSVREE